MSVPYKVGEELQEKRHNHQADVHTIHIGIGSNYNVVIAQSVHAFFNIQRMLQQVELLVLINNLLRKPVTVEWLTPQREYSLCFHAAAFGNRTTRRITLSNKQSRL